jgi:hypothetical protein
LAPAAGAGRCHTGQKPASAWMEVSYQPGPACHCISWYMHCHQAGRLPPLQTSRAGTEAYQQSCASGMCPCSRYQLPCVTLPTRPVLRHMRWSATTSTHLQTPCSTLSCQAILSSTTGHLCDKSGHKTKTTTELCAVVSFQQS